MSRVYKNQKGFSAVEIILTVVIIGLIGFVGWYAWRANKQDKSERQGDASSTSAETENKSEGTEKTTKELALGNNAATVQVPLNWTSEKGADARHCGAFATTSLVCVEGAKVWPDEKLSTRYGDGTEYFYVVASVFENKDNMDSKTWLTEVYQAGEPDSDDVSSSDKINGYDAYYTERTFEGDGTSVHQRYYVLSANGKSVVIYARTYEPGQLGDGTKVGDFRKFEPQIQQIAESVKIN